MRLEPPQAAGPRIPLEREACAASDPHYDVRPYIVSLSRPHLLLYYRRRIKALDAG